MENESGQARVFRNFDTLEVVNLAELRDPRSVGVSGPRGAGASYFSKAHRTPDEGAKRARCPKEGDAGKPGQGSASQSTRIRTGIGATRKRMRLRLMVPSGCTRPAQDNSIRLRSNAGGTGSHPNPKSARWSLVTPSDPPFGIQECVPKFGSLSWSMASPSDLY